MELICQAKISSHVCRIRVAWVLAGDANFVTLDPPLQKWSNFILLEEVSTMNSGLERKIFTSLARTKAGGMLCSGTKGYCTAPTSARVVRT